MCVRARARVCCVRLCVLIWYIKINTFKIRNVTLAEIYMFYFISSNTFFNGFYFQFQCVNDNNPTTDTI